MDTPFQYLNLENKWPGFQLEGLVIKEGALSLSPLPGTPEAVGPVLDPVAGLRGPAGMGLDAQGNLYLADPAHHQIIKVDGCDGRATPLPCLHGPGSEVGQLYEPHGLVVGPRQALYIADSGNHRVQVVDLRTQQLRAVWGQPDPFAPPEAGTADGRFNQPWDLAVDQADDFYVVDYGNRRIQKFTADGRVQPAFWQTMQAATAVPQEPVAVTMALIAEVEHLLVLDQATLTLLVFHLDGSLNEDATAQWQNLAERLSSPVGVVASADFLYVADAAQNRILVFDWQGTFRGFAQSGLTHVQGVVLDKEGRLLIHPGGGTAVQRLTPTAVYGTCGSFLAGPFTAGALPVRWQRVAVTAPPLPASGHIQFFSYTSDTVDGSPGNQPAPPANCANLTSALALTTTAVHTALDTWQAMATDSFDFLVLNPSGRYLWLAGLVQGDGSETAVLQQIRLEYDHESWLRFLPAVHQRHEANRAFLDPALLLFESVLADQERLIETLPQLFDAYAAANDGAPFSWLDWLASWLAFDLDESWTETERRDALAEAFGLYGRRGTVASLRGLIALYAGATAHITEPARFASLWSLGESTFLGFDTMLAPAHAQGAVVGTTATLNQSHLIEDEDYGAPLFEDVAHRFCVQVYAADLGQADMSQVRQVIEREKPAHTSYDLCLIEAKMRVGFQARLGIDTIVAGLPPDLALDTPHQLGWDTRLPDAPEWQGALGKDTRVGVSTSLI